MSDDEKERQKTSIAAMETDVALAKWCMFCGNCCNDKVTGKRKDADVIKREMNAASGKLAYRAFRREGKGLWDPLGETNKTICDKPLIMCKVKKLKISINNGFRRYIFRGKV